MSSQKWEVLYTGSNEPKILINFNTMQIKMIQEFDNNKKRKRTIYDDCVQYDITDDHDENNRKEDNNDTKLDVQFHNDDTEDDDIEDEDSGSSSKCNHYIKNHILASHKNDVRAKALEYMHDKKINKKRGAIHKWVKEALN